MVIHQARKCKGIGPFKKLLEEKEKEVELKRKYSQLEVFKENFLVKE